MTSTDAVARPRPVDADAARDRLDEGSRTIAALLDSLTEGTGTARRVIPVDPRDLGLAGGDGRLPEQRPTPRCSAVPTRACRSN